LFTTTNCTCGILPLSLKHGRPSYRTQSQNDRRRRSTAAPAALRNCSTVGMLSTPAKDLIIEAFASPFTPLAASPPPHVHTVIKDSNRIKLLLNRGTSVFVLLHPTKFLQRPCFRDGGSR
jgi:hypothetical protein